MPRGTGVRVAWGSGIVSDAGPKMMKLLNLAEHELNVVQLLGRVPRLPHPRILLSVRPSEAELNLQTPNVI